MAAIIARPKILEHPTWDGSVTAEFVGFLVGLNVGKVSLPDNGLHSVINNFGCKCRECRVSVGVETPQEITFGEPGA